MKHYTYYPGCSAEATAIPLGLSVPPVTKALDRELLQLLRRPAVGQYSYEGTS
jgi:hypothetical protein